MRSDTDLQDRDTHSAPESRHTTDMLLRVHGWAVHARPEGSEPLWKKGERVLPQREALRTIGTGGHRRT